MKYQVLLTHQAKKDVEKLSPKMREKLRAILTEVLAQNPYEGKKLLGDLSGCFSYRLTFKDRIVYTIDEKKKTLYVLRAKTHYGD